MIAKYEDFENIELVNKGIRLLHPVFSGYIGQSFRRVYGNAWWNHILALLYDQRSLPAAGSYDVLIDSLDFPNCIRLIDRGWRDVFSVIGTNLSCRTWSRELMAHRNIVSHHGQHDIEQPLAERALDTMVLLCMEIDPDTAEDIREVYREVRSRADDAPTTKIMHEALAQPVSISSRGELTENSLLHKVGTDIVQKTNMTRKLTFGGKTEIYPVYRVRLDALYYNDQNDRIATWISKYESENGEESLKSLNKEIYNRTIEDFIVESNPESISKTQKNIALVGQREAGVTLADGRIVDGNRRFTCLKRNQKESGEVLYFETAILDMDIHADKKQIKLLELSIQHGEEKKVDYDSIDYAIGTYRDIEKTKLITIDEYAASTNEPVAEIRKRIEVAKIICEFLKHINLPDQYHVAREYQLYDLFNEMLPVLNKLDPTEQETLKVLAFNTVIMNATTDRRKFIRDIKGLVKSGAYKEYFDKQDKIARTVKSRFDDADITSKENIDTFAKDNSDITAELQSETEAALLKSRNQQLKSKPADTTSKCIALMMDVDPRLFKSMNPDEKEALRASLSEIERISKKFKELL